MIDQNNPFGEGDEDFEKDVAPTSTQHTSFGTRDDFAPWHKPRKQWIRNTQWAKTIGNLADTLQLKESNEPLRYLSLPGPDLLDVRSIVPDCEEREIELQFVGLNGGSDDPDSALSLALINQVREMPGIHAASEVVKDKLENLGIPKSTAYLRILKIQRSFDVINIDLCGSFAESMPEESMMTIPSALLALVQHQARCRTRDWLFFLTTRSDRRSVTPEIMEKFINWLNAAIAATPSMKTDILTSGLLQPNEFVGNTIDIAALSPASHSNAFAIGIGHWILQALSSEVPPWRADMLKQFEYHVAMHDASCDMLSLGFYCKRVPIPRAQDQLGIARVPTTNSTPLETIVKTCTDKIHRSVAEGVDLDVYLHNEAAEYQAALNASADLLGNAHYNKDAYFDFAEKDRIKTAEFLIEKGLVTAQTPE